MLPFTAGSGVQATCHVRVAYPSPVFSSSAFVSFCLHYLPAGNHPWWQGHTMMSRFYSAKRGRLPQAWLATALTFSQLQLAPREREDHFWEELLVCLLLTRLTKGLDPLTWESVAVQCFSTICLHFDLGQIYYLVRHHWVSVYWFLLFLCLPHHPGQHALFQS